MRFGKLDSRSVIVARAFFHAATKLSDDDEDILPQEDSLDVKLSVYGLFSELFPEHVVSKECGSIKTGLTRLQFNKLGYETYVKEQSRRVPAPRAKPGNPGYGFRRAKWRNVSDGAEDQCTMQETLLAIGLPRARCDYVRMRVDQVRMQWDQARRPSRPAGPGRPRGRARGDKPDDTTSEAREPFIHNYKCLYPGLGSISSPMSNESAVWQYQQAEQMALLRTALERSQQQQHHHHHQPALGPPLAGLLASHKSAVSVGAMMPSASAGLPGMSGLLLPPGLLPGGQWAAGMHPQQTQAAALGGMPLGLAGVGAGGGAGGHLAALNADAVRQMQQQVQQMLQGAAGATHLVHGIQGHAERPALANTDLGGVSMPQSGDSLAGLDVGGLSGTQLAGLASRLGLGIGERGLFESLGAASHRPDSPGQAMKGLGSVLGPSRQAEDRHPIKRQRDAEEQVAEAGMSAAKGARKKGRRSAMREGSKVGSGSKAAAAADSTTSHAAKDEGLAKRIRAATKEPFQKKASLASLVELKTPSPPLLTRADTGSGSSSVLSSSASTSLAASPASRAVDTVEEDNKAALQRTAECKNKASLTNLITV